MVVALCAVSMTTAIGALAALVAPAHVVALLVLGCLLMFSWIAVLSAARTVWFDSVRQLVVVRRRYSWLASRELSIPLQRFVAVISYLPLGENAPTVVALLEHPAFDRALRIAGFATTWRAKSFWSYPKIVENGEVEAFRQRLAEQLGLRDGGFKNVYPGLRPSENAI